MSVTPPACHCIFYNLAKTSVSFRFLLFLPCLFLSSLCVCLQRRAVASSLSWTGPSALLVGLKSIHQTRTVCGRWSLPLSTASPCSLRPLSWREMRWVHLYLCVNVNLNTKGEWVCVTESFICVFRCVNTTMWRCGAASRPTLSCMGNTAAPRSLKSSPLSTTTWELSSSLTTLCPKKASRPTSSQVGQVCECVLYVCVWVYMSLSRTGREQWSHICANMWVFGA